MDGAGRRVERDRDREGAAGTEARQHETGAAERGGEDSAGRRDADGTEQGGGEVKTLDVMFNLWCWFVLILLGLMIGGVR